MKKFKWAVLCVALLLGGCTQKDELGVDALQQSTTAKERLYAIKQVGQPGVATKGVAVNGKTWEPGSTIKIKFLNGDAAIQAKVKQYAAEWLQYANLKFEYVGAGDNADVKVGFEWGDEFPYISWSTIGTDCQQVPQDEASLNFVGLEGEEDYDFVRSEVLRAFGHILGLGFEHRNPNSSIVFKYTTATEKNRLASYFGLSMDDILEHIIPLYEVDHTNYTEYDSESIMLLPIPGTFLTNPKFGTAQNLELSETDKTFIAGLYPKFALKSLFPNRQFMSGAEAYNGKVYLTDFCNGIYSLDKQGILREELRSLLLGTRQNIISFGKALYFNVWNGEGEKIYYLDPQDDKIKELQGTVGLFQTAVESKDGTLYLGTDHGLYYIEKENVGLARRKLTPLFENAGQSSIYNLAIDREGNIFFDETIGLDAAKALYFGADGVLHELNYSGYLPGFYTSPEGLVYTFVPNNQLGYVDENKKLQILFENREEFRAVDLVLSKDGMFYFPTITGIYYLDASKQLQATNLTEGSFTFIAHTVSDATYFYSGNIVYRLDHILGNQNITKVATDLYVKDIVETADGRQYFLTHERGLCILQK